jgi:hypothetical protein
MTEVRSVFWSFAVMHTSMITEICHCCGRMTGRSEVRVGMSTDGGYVIDAANAVAIGPQALARLVDVKKATVATLLAAAEHVPTFKSYVAQRLKFHQARAPIRYQDCTTSY